VGLLSTAQKAALAAGCRVRQTWKVVVPTAADHASYDVNLIHDDDDSAQQTVTDPGKRLVAGFNISMAVEGELRPGDYSFTVGNGDGKFYPGTTTSHWTYDDLVGGYYYAKPRECIIRHQVYAWVDGAWEELLFLRYEGRVKDVQYSDGGHVDEAKPGTCTINTENNAVSEILRYEWTDDDGDETDTGRNLYQLV
jgi:hypothetical protein